VFLYPEGWPYRDDWQAGAPIFLLLFTGNLSRRITNVLRKCLVTQGAIARLAYFFDLSLPTLDAAVHNSRMLFANQSLRSCNKIVQWFLTIRVY